MKSTAVSAAPQQKRHRSCLEWYLKVLRNYVGFSGRARRTEFWMFTLFNMVASIITQLIDRIFGWEDWSAYAGPVTTLYFLAVFLPSLAVAVRRLHDTNRSGWWLLLGLVPLVGFIVLIVFYAQAGNSGANKYGADPRTPRATRAPGRVPTVCARPCRMPLGSLSPSSIRVHGVRPRR